MRIHTAISLFLISQLASAAPFETQQWQTPNGVTVIFYPAKEVPILDISIAFAAGSAYDGGAYGLSTLTAQLMNQGNNGLDASAIAEKIEHTGAQYGATSTRDMVALNLRTLTRSDALNEAITTYADIINHPDFPEASFTRQKNQQLMSIQQVKDSPDDVANQVFFQALYHEHPYAHPIIGDTSHVTALTLNQVQAFYKRYFVGKNAVLVMVGAIDSPTAHRLANQLAGQLPLGEPSPSIPKAKPLLKSESQSIPFPSSQTILRLGQLGINHDDPRYFPLLVGNYTLGGGSLVSELAIELREKRGLTYGVYSQYSPMPGLGPFVISLSTRRDQAATAVNLTREVLSAFISKGPTASELQSAKQFLTGGFPLSLASNRNIADILLKMAFYHLPSDYLNTYLQHINDVTLNEVKNAFQTQIVPGALLQVSVGKK